jgi:hypothetical protein
MDSKLFEVLGKYAGLAGLSIGLVLVIVSGILKLKIFSKLTSANTYSIIQQLIYMTFAVGVVGIIAWVSINVKQKASSDRIGRVASSTTKRAIQDAEITLSGRPETARTDGVGNCRLSFQQPLPTESLHLFISKDGFEPYDRMVGLGQNLEAEIVPAATSVQTTVTHRADSPPPLLISNETYSSDDVASGACADYGGWGTVCTPEKPQGWTIISSHFDLTGDRAGCAYARCEPLGTATPTKICYRFQTQGHSEECGHSGNTGIHYSKGVLYVVWQHPS